MGGGPVLALPACGGPASLGRWPSHASAKRDESPVSAGSVGRVRESRRRRRVRAKFDPKGDSMVIDSRNVLIVEQSRDVRDRIGGWLEGAGFQVMACPGPTAPDYSCVAVRPRSLPPAPAPDP